MSIESKGYVATKADIVDMVKQRWSASNVISSTNNTYLKVLVASTQHELGLTVMRASKAQSDDETIEAHIEALDKLHASWYKVMIDTALTLDIPADDDRKPNEVANSRCGFARSSYTTLRNWMLRGRHSLKEITAKTANKEALYQDTPKRESGPPKALQRKPIQKATERILGMILTAAKTDAKTALEVLHDTIIALSRGFDDMGVNAKEVREAVEHTSTGVLNDAVARLRKKAA